MDREHLSGVITFAEAQLQYLIRSAHGKLGRSVFRLQLCNAAARQMDGLGCCAA